MQQHDLQSLYFHSRLRVRVSLQKFSLQLSCSLVGALIRWKNKSKANFFNYQFSIQWIFFWPEGENLSELLNVHWQFHRLYKFVLDAWFCRRIAVFLIEEWFSQFKPSAMCAVVLWKRNVWNEFGAGTLMKRVEIEDTKQNGKFVMCRHV